MRSGPISNFGIMVIIILILMFVGSFFLMKSIMKKLKDYDNIEED